jgi:hypothetical protein
MLLQGYPFYVRHIFDGAWLTATHSVVTHTGLTQELPGLATRARRYSMYLEDGNIKVRTTDEVRKT